MNSTQIKYFLMLCQNKNYSETGRQLFVSQSTISKQIAALEEELGVKLFERSTNRLSLTMQGAIMKEAFTQSTKLVDDAITEARNLTNKIAGTIRIGILEDADFGTSIFDSLTSIVNQLRNIIDISIIFLPHWEINQCLHENTIDIAITFKDEVDAHADLDYTKLRTSPMGIIAHKSLEVINGGILDVQKLRTLPFYFVSYGSLGYKDHLKQQEALLGITSSQYRDMPNIDSMLLNVELGLGVATVTNTPRIQNNEDMEFYAIEGSTLTAVAAWNKSNNNDSRPLIIKRMRHIIIENGQF